MIDILESQKAEANSQFGKFIERNYEDWFYQKQIDLCNLILYSEN
jgi:hypothetical protein